MKNLSVLTKAKIKILEDGISFEPISLFSNLKKSLNFRCKTLFKKPVSDGTEVYDHSDCNEIIPSELLLADENAQSIVKCRYNPLSPVKIDYVNNSLILYLDNSPLNIKAEFVSDIPALDIKIDKEHYVKDYIDVVGLDRISLLLFEGCYNWLCGNQCKFCDLHPKRRQDRVCRPSLNDVHKFENTNKWWDSQKDIFFKNTAISLKYLMDNYKFMHNHLFIMAGNLNDPKFVWKYLLEYVEFLSKYINLENFDTIANVCPHDNTNSLIKLKNLGIKQVQYNLEIANEDIFKFSCPGKLNYDMFINKLKEATTIFGKGNVCTNFVLGLQSTEELLKECEKFAEEGIVSDYSVFQPKKNTPYANKKAPKMKDVIFFTEKLTDIYIKYNFKPIFCSVSSRSSIINEIYYDKCQ